ncbi:MAG: hypothetical protein HY744_19270 [Deltaproteobacteria bacterium]|nr:hypothetical protein [Deltaproteobacteria bacterium]
MSGHRSVHAVFEQCRAHPRGDDLARLVHVVALAAADERRARLGDGLQEIVADADLSPEDAQLAGTNVLQALEADDLAAAGGPTRMLLGCLLARGVALDPPAGAAAVRRLAEQLTWLSAHACLDATLALDEALEADAAAVWEAIGAVVLDGDRAREGSAGRASSLAAAVALCTSGSPAARKAREKLAAEATDPSVRALLACGAGEGAGAGTEPAAASVQGEIVPAPLRLPVLVLSAMTGVLLLRHLWYWLTRLVLRCRRPAELRVERSGVSLSCRIELLGRPLRQTETRFARESLARAVREIRYGRLGMYAGLVGLGLGTYLGVSLLTDGARAGSPSLIALGAAIFALGLLLDLVLGVLLPARPGQARLVLVPRKGRPVAMRTRDAVAAERALRRLGG